MKKFAVACVLIFLLTGCVTIQSEILRKQLDACESNELDTLVYKDQFGGTLMVLCTVPDDEADQIVEIQIMPETVKQIKGGS